MKKLLRFLLILTLLTAAQSHADDDDDDTTNHQHPSDGYPKSFNDLLEELGEDPNDVELIYVAPNIIDDPITRAYALALAAYNRNDNTNAFNHIGDIIYQSPNIHDLDPDIIELLDKILRRFDRHTRAYAQALIAYNLNEPSIALYYILTAIRQIPNIHNINPGIIDLFNDVFEDVLNQEEDLDLPTRTMINYIFSAIRVYEQLTRAGHEVGALGLYQLAKMPYSWSIWAYNKLRKLANLGHPYACYWCAKLHLTASAPQDAVDEHIKYWLRVAERSGIPEATALLEVFNENTHASHEPGTVTVSSSNAVDNGTTPASPNSNLYVIPNPHMNLSPTELRSVHLAPRTHIKHSQ